MKSKTAGRGGRRHVLQQDAIKTKDLVIESGFGAFNGGFNGGFNDENQAPDCQPGSTKKIICEQVLLQVGRGEWVNVAEKQRVLYGFCEECHDSNEDDDNDDWAWVSESDYDRSPYWDSPGYYGGYYGGFTSSDEDDWSGWAIG